MSMEAGYKHVCINFTSWYILTLCNTTKIQVINCTNNVILTAKYNMYAIYNLNLNL
jgi:hypothetical protein